MGFNPSPRGGGFFSLHRKFGRISYVMKLYAQLRARNKSCARNIAVLPLKENK